MVQEEIVSGFTIDIDPTNGSVLLDAGELRDLSSKQYNKRDKVIRLLTMADYVRKHTAKGLDKSQNITQKPWN